MPAQRWYLESNGSNYVEGIHKIPKGAVKISEEEYCKNKVRLLDDSGAPIDANAEPAPLTRDQVISLRLRAYADPIIGSDRYFSEVNRMRLNELSGWEEIKLMGDARYAEIQQVYPWPK